MTTEKTVPEWAQKTVQAVYEAEFFLDMMRRYNWKYEEEARQKLWEAIVAFYVAKSEATGIPLWHVVDGLTEEDMAAAVKFAMERLESAALEDLPL